jgi:PAS domain S-box-containing protein
MPVLKPAPPEATALAAGGAMSARELRRAIAEQSVVLDHAGVGIVLIQQRRVVRCNQRFAEIYGHASPTAVEGLATRGLYADEADYHALGGAAYPVMAGGRAYKTELRQRKAGGTPFWARLTGTLVDPADKERGSVWIVEDIEAQKAAETALAEVREQHQIIFDHALVGIVFRAS